MSHKAPLLSRISTTSKNAYQTTKEMVYGASFITPKSSLLTASYGSAYLLSHVLHDWGDEDCQAILATCRRSMPDNALLVVVDLVIDQGESAQPNPTGAMMDLYMLSLFGIAGGKERNEVEFRTLIENSGFIVKQVKRLPSGNGIIFAYPK
jgi:hypothetical protein